MAKKIGYKPASANKDKGFKTHGTFSNDGQKQGKKVPTGSESNVDQKQLAFMKKVVNDLRKQGKRRVQSMPDSGAFH